MSDLSSKNTECVATPDKSGATSRMMVLLELLDEIQGQCDSIIAVSLGHDSAPREAAPSAILDYQVDFAIGQAREVSEKLATVYRAL